MGTVYQFGFRLSTVFDTPILQAVKLKQLVEKKLAMGLSQRELAEKIGVSHGTINNIIAGSPPKTLSTLQKFADYFHVGLHELSRKDQTTRHLLQEDLPHLAEHVAEYLVQHSSARRIVQLLEQLDEDEIATLERCAEAFTKSTPDVRQHLIGQLKLIERLVEHESHEPKGRAAPAKKSNG